MGRRKNAPFHEDVLEKKWPGKQRLVISLDIGATQTAVVVALLNNGSIPKIIPISCWPGQEDRMYDVNVPTVVLYNENGQLITCGAEALTRQNEKLADAQGWALAQNFKLRLHPNAVIEKNDLALDALPPNIRLERVYTDFIGYVLDHTRKHLTFNTGSDPWTQDAEIVFAHPNGWGKHEQNFLLGVAVSAGLISEPARSKQVYFVEEAEASARYCISTANSAFATQLREGTKFIVCDAGGSTVDVSTYKIESISSDRMTLRELRVPGCVAAGGLHVDRALGEYLTEHLMYEYGPTGARDFIRDGIRDFQQHGKRVFVSNEQDISVKVGGRDLNSYTLDITHGVMQIPGKRVNTFFSPCVNRMVECLNVQLNPLDIEPPGIEYIILTGGLGESPYVKKRLQDTFRQRCGIVVANSLNSKAVAIGALMLAVGCGNVGVKRQERKFETLLTDFATILKIVGGLIAMVAPLIPLLL